MALFRHYGNHTNEVPDLQSNADKVTNQRANKQQERP